MSSRAPPACRSARSGARRVPPVDQELGEVPLDRPRAEEPRRFLFQRLEQRMGVRAVDLDLGEHREGHVVVEGAEILDLGLVARLLMAELVAGEAEHGEAAFAKAPVQRLEPRILRREAALARDIDDEQRLPGEIAERARPRRRWS